MLNRFLCSLKSIFNGGRSAPNKTKSTKTEPPSFKVHVARGGGVYVDPEEYLSTPKAKAIMAKVDRALKNLNSPEGNKQQK